MDSWLESRLDPSTIAVARPALASRTHDQAAVSAWPVPGEADTDCRVPAIADAGATVIVGAAPPSATRGHREPHQTVSCIADASVYPSFELVTDTVERRRV